MAQRSLGIEREQMLMMYHEAVEVSQLEQNVSSSFQRLRVTGKVPPPRPRRCFGE